MHVGLHCLKQIKMAFVLDYVLVARYLQAITWKTVDVVAKKASSVSPTWG